MGEFTTIGWCHHTFNIVWGCEKVSEACKHCYAEAWAKRTGRLNLWGPGSDRMLLSDKYWKQPILWDHMARDAGERHRVFCSSMADVFDDHPTVASQRERLWPLIAATPNLDWLLLTKRPQNIAGAAPPAWVLDKWPDNVWPGITAENQQRFDERWPWIDGLNARFPFVSFEPLLGHIRLPRGLKGRLAWGIVGGESGPDDVRRELDLDHAYHLLGQLRGIDAAAFLKQDSARTPGQRGRFSDEMWGLKEFPTAVAA